jgi:hypothetical protein
MDSVTMNQNLETDETKFFLDVHGTCTFHPQDLDSLHFFHLKIPQNSKTLKNFKNINLTLLFKVGEQENFKPVILVRTLWTENF